MVNSNKRLSFGKQSQLFKSIGITPLASNREPRLANDNLIDIFNAYKKTLKYIKNSLYRKGSTGRQGHLRHYCLFNGDKSKGCRCNLLTPLERELLHIYINYNYLNYKTFKARPVSIHKFIYINRNNKKYNVKLYSDYDIEQVDNLIQAHRLDRVTL